MKKSLFAGATLTALFSGHALANEPLTLVLDWYINPDHAPIMVAEQIGAFKAQGLDVRIIPPSDPALPPRMVAARQADLAITYQPQVHFFADEGLPLVRVGTLINSPLNTVIALDKQIKTPADLATQFMRRRSVNSSPPCRREWAICAPIRRRAGRRSPPPTRSLGPNSTTRRGCKPCPCSPPIRQRWIKRATRLTNSFYITISW